MGAAEKNSISADCFFFFLLLIPHFFRFPELTVTAFPFEIWSWLERVVPEPTHSLPKPTNLLVASILMLFLLCYLFAHVWQLHAAGSARGPHRLKLALIMASFTLIILVPAMHEVWLRRALGPETHAHDGAILVEEAIKKTLQGRNVYADNFHGSPLEQSRFAAPQIWQRYGMECHPALKCFVYLPFTFLIPLPFYRAAVATVGWFDLRFVLIPAYMLLIRLAYEFARGDQRKIIAVQFLALNTFLATFLITGRNEALPLVMLAATILLLERHSIWAQLFLGLACLTKQYIWLTVPFFGLFLIRENEQKGFFGSAVAAFRALWPFWIIFIGGLLPYFIWDPTAFIKGILLHSGDHPIKGIGALGFGTWALYFGWAKSATDKFPFLLIQALLTIPIMMLFFKWQIRRNTLARALLGSGLSLFIFFYFSRYFHDSYLGVIITILVFSYCVEGGEGEEAPAVLQDGGTLPRQAG